MEVCHPIGVRKGSWSEEEDRLLRKCIEKFGEGKWHQVPHRAGLNRCRKSCRLRWLNYLKPNIKRGSFSVDEIDVMLRLHKLLGNRWSLIAGRLPGRTANDVKNYWNTHLQKKITQLRESRFKTLKKVTKVSKIIKPQPRPFSKELPWLKNKTNAATGTTIATMNNLIHKPVPKSAQTPPLWNRNTVGITHAEVQGEVPWWDDMVLDNGNTWWSLDEPNFGDSLTTPGIEAADQEGTFQDSQTRDWVDSFLEDNMEIWDFLGDELVLI